MPKTKIEKIQFSFDNGQYLDWERLSKPVRSNEGKNLYWKVSSGVGGCYTGGIPSLSYSLWLLDYLDELFLNDSIELIDERKPISQQKNFPR